MTPVEQASKERTPKLRRKYTWGQRFRNIRSIRWFRKVFVPNPFNLEKQRLYWHIIPYTMCNHPRLDAVYDLAWKVERQNIEGAFVECGVWKGGCAAIMAFVAHQANSGRQTWLFDSFEGLPEPTTDDGDMAAEYAYGKASGDLASIDQLVAPLEDVKRLFFSTLQLDEENIVIGKGWFQDTLPEARDRMGPISILRLDGDWYESIRCCLDNLYDSVVPGGYVIVDDYNFWKGCKKAVDEFIEERGLRVNIVEIDRTGVFRETVTALETTSAARAADQTSSNEPAMADNVSQNPNWQPTWGYRVRHSRPVRWTRKFYFRDPFAFQKQRLFWRVLPYTMCNYEKLTNVYDLAHAVERDGVKGDFVECGVWRGGCAAVMAALAHQAPSGRNTWLFDSFEGLPEPSEQDGEKAIEFAAGRSSGRLLSIRENVAPLEEAKRLLFTELHLDPERVFLEKGWFQDTLPGARDRLGSIAVLRLDGDWYDSTWSCLENLYDKVSSGGYIIIDDYAFWEGCQKAVDEFLAERGIEMKFIVIDETGVYCQKP